ncbi:uncharacterized protein LOC143934972 [Lithobates pipiens]
MIFLYLYIMFSFPATMTTTYSWTILILVSLTSIVSAQSCKWLHRNQEVVNRQILQNFKQMIPAEDSPVVCFNSNFSVPDIKHLYSISKVESAAIAVREVANQTIQFYRRYEEKLDYHWPAWERLQELLYYQEQQLSDCIPEGAENQLFIQGISQQFIILQRILEEQVSHPPPFHPLKGHFFIDPQGSVSDVKTTLQVFYQQIIHWLIFLSKALWLPHTHTNIYPFPQDNKVCARRAVNAEIQRNLLLSSQLSSRMRRLHLLRSLS